MYSTYTGSKPRWKQQRGERVLLVLFRCWCPTFLRLPDNRNRFLVRKFRARTALIYFCRSWPLDKNKKKMHFEPCIICFSVRQKSQGLRFALPWKLQLRPGFLTSIKSTSMMLLHPFTRMYFTGDLLQARVLLCALASTRV